MSLWQTDTAKWEKSVVLRVAKDIPKISAIKQMALAHTVHTFQKTGFIHAEYKSTPDRSYRVESILLKLPCPQYNVDVNVHVVVICF